MHVKRSYRDIEKHVSMKQKPLAKDFFGSSPAPFVGRFGYPYVNVGILSPPEVWENAWEYDAPRHWAQHNYQIPQIIDFRSSLINARFKSYVKQKSHRFLEISQEIGMAAQPVDVEVNLKHKPKFRLHTDTYAAPTGPNAQIEHLAVTSNPKVHTRVERAVADTDLKASEAVISLYEHSFDENFLSRVLSVGNLGIGTQRKLVPTRWSITAVDDTLGKNRIAELKEYPVADYMASFGGYLGNYYLILCFPEVWSYELFETYLPEQRLPGQHIDYMTDYEPYEGRKTYASSTVGGYYAARLAIVDKLKSMKRQASVLALRFITDEYAVPLGVWVVREATRKALLQKPITFASKELMLKYAQALIQKKFNYSPDFLLRESLLLKNLKHQTKLSQF